eukprot:sb/3471681/
MNNRQYSGDTPPSRAASTAPYVRRVTGGPRSRNTIHYVPQHQPPQGMIAGQQQQQLPPSYYPSEGYTTTTNTQYNSYPAQEMIPIPQVQANTNLYFNVQPQFRASNPPNPVPRRRTICCRLSTTGAKKTVPVFLGKRLKIFGNPVQQQQEWGRENFLPGIENNHIPMSGMLFRPKIARV